MQTDVELITAVLMLKFELGNYHQIFEQIGGSPALWWKVGERGVNSPKARQLLGFDPLMIKVKPCRCGGVHKLKNCPHDRKRTKQYRRAASFESQKRMELFDEMLEYYNSTLTDWMNSSLDYYLDKHRHKNPTLKDSN